MGWPCVMSLTPALRLLSSSALTMISAPSQWSSASTATKRRMRPILTFMMVNVHRIGLVYLRIWVTDRTIDHSSPFPFWPITFILSFLKIDPWRNNTLELQKAHHLIHDWSVQVVFCHGNCASYLFYQNINSMKEVLVQPFNNSTTSGKQLIAVLMIVQTLMACTFQMIPFIFYRPRFYCQHAEELTVCD